MMKRRKTMKRLLITGLTIMLAITTMPFSGHAIESVAAENEVPSYEENEVTEGKILSFERNNPVYSLNAFKGSTFEDLGLPDELRVVMEIEVEDKAKFIEATPVAETDGTFAYYSYGYVAPKADTVKEGALSIYTISYFDGTTGYRVYGSLGDEENSFYACDEQGNIIGKVCTISVTWDESQYKNGLIGKEQKLTPAWNENLKYEGDEVYASITETDIEEGHSEEELTEEEGDQGQASGEVIPAAMALRSAARTSANTTYQQALEDIGTYTKTNGNLPGGGQYGTGVPGTWKDYVNTIFLNKKLNTFDFTDSGVAEEWKWDGTVADIEPTETETAATNPHVIPEALDTDGDGYTDGYNVYSVQQLIWALNQHYNKIIYIKKDLDFNGQNQNWSVIDVKGTGLQIEGNDHAFYNLCSYTGDTIYADSSGTTNHVIRGAFINTDFRYQKLYINDLIFDSAFCATFNQTGGGLFGYVIDYGDKDNDGRADNVIIKDSVFYNGGECRAAVEGRSDYYNWGKHISPIGVLGSDYGTRINACSVVGCTVYGADHVVGFLTRAADAGETNSFKYSFVADTTICGTGGHSAGFISCQMGKSDVQYCFTNVDMYGSIDISGFNLAVSNSTMKNCFSTGKIEGYKNIAGFYWYNDATITDCYSTALVGMRSEATNLGGFTLNDSGVAVTNCYAAGEVGNYTTSIGHDQSSTTAGGFSYSGKGTYQNCYYDKQTTGMREWVTASENTQKGQTLSGITGVLTTDSDKAGNGLASKPATDDVGFAGFGTTGPWRYKEGYYPQIDHIYLATNFESYWGGAYQAGLAKANSYVSASTVYLDTWDEGYDWDSTGLRSKDIVSYARSPEEAKEIAKKQDDDDLLHLGNEYTYDTVRSIISDFTSTKEASYSYSIKEGSGALATIDNWKTNESSGVRGALTIGNNGSSWQVNHSGLEWVDIKYSLSESAWRPLRLISLMNVEAGADRQLKVNEFYDHREDAEFTIMESLSDNLVVGFDDDNVWAVAATQGYPGYQAGPYDSDAGVLIGKNGEEITTFKKHYSEVPSAPTSFKDSENAWIYTEIWMTERNGKVLEEPLSVKVTGEGTNGTELTATEEQWMGALPIGMGMHENTVFEVSYYWMLEDGRYGTDMKKIELLPGKYDLVEKVYNEDGSENSTALRLGTVKSDQISVGESTSHSDMLLDNERGEKVVAAWLNDNPSQTKVTSLSVNFSLGGSTYSRSLSNRSGPPTIYNPKAGDEITIRVPYYGYTTQTETDVPGGDKYARTVTQYEPVDIDYVYKVIEEPQADGSVMNYLIFDKEATWESNGWSPNLETEGISFADPDAMPFDNMSIMQIEHDIEVVLTVSGEYGLSLTKTDGDTDQSLAGVAFNLYEAETNDTRTLNQVKSLPVAEVTYNGGQLTTEGAVTGTDGILDFKNLQMGKWYYLVETAPLPGYVSLNGMIRLHRDTEGVIRMTPLSRDGTPVGDEAVYNPDSTAELEPGTVELSLQTWSSAEGEGSYVSTSIKNYQGVNMPESGGRGIEWLYLLAGLMTIIGLILVLATQKKTVKNEK